LTTGTELVEGNDDDVPDEDEGAGAVCLATALLSAWLNETSAIAGSGPQIVDGKA